jgi:hypothetical protein
VLTFLLLSILLIDQYNSTNLFWEEKASLNPQTAALVPHYIAVEDISMSGWFEDEHGLKFINFPQRDTGFRGRMYTISDASISSKPKGQGEKVALFRHPVW